MWIYEKKLEFPIKIKKPDGRLAKIMLEQYGGPYSIGIYVHHKNRYHTSKHYLSIHQS
ncbi:hypothetical protein DSECCO2_326910 [anaerobic digester metagenome]